MFKSLNFHHPVKKIVEMEQSKKRKKMKPGLDGVEYDKENLTKVVVSAVPPCRSCEERDRSIEELKRENEELRRKLAPFEGYGQADIIPANHLLDIPRPLLYKILSFTSLQEIAVLDTAFCNR